VCMYPCHWSAPQSWQQRHCTRLCTSSSPPPPHMPAQPAPLSAHTSLPKMSFCIGIFSNIVLFNYSFTGFDTQVPFGVSCIHVFSCMYVTFDICDTREPAPPSAHTSRTYRYLSRSRVYMFFHRCTSHWTYVTHVSQHRRVHIRPGQRLSCLWLSSISLLNRSL